MQKGQSEKIKQEGKKKEKVTVTNVTVKESDY